MYKWNLILHWFLSLGFSATVASLSFLTLFTRTFFVCLFSFFFFLHLHFGNFILKQFRLDSHIPRSWRFIPRVAYSFTCCTGCFFSWVFFPLKFMQKLENWLTFSESNRQQPIRSFTCEWTLSNDINAFYFHSQNKYHVEKNTPYIFCYEWNSFFSSFIHFHISTVSKFHGYLR